MMSRVKAIEYPYTLDKLKELKVGDTVSFSGPVFTGRDRLHKYLYEGGDPGVSLDNAAIYHCGPIMIPDNGSWISRAAGPTTSIREEPYMADLIRKHRLRVIIGKGGMGVQTAKACAKYGCIYLHAVGGAGAALAQNIDSVKGVRFLKEFGVAEAMWELFVKDMFAVVAIDTRGHNLNKRISTASRRVLKQLTSD